MYGISNKSDASIKSDVIYVEASYLGSYIYNKTIISGNVISENEQIHPYLCISTDPPNNLTVIFVIGIDINNQTSKFIARNVKYFYF